MEPGSSESALREVHSSVTQGLADLENVDVEGDGTPVDPANTMAVQALARKLYGGCRVNVAVKPWLQENKHGRGIRCDLLAIQFAGDDKPFGEAAPDVSNVFGAVATQAAAPVAAAPVMPLPPFMMG